MPTIKESSDELNPPVIQSGAVPAPPVGRKTALDYLALALATCGVGYLPLAPGTWGSALGVALYLLFQAQIIRVFTLMQDRGLDATSIHLLRTNCLIIFAALVALVGIWAATRTEMLVRRKDPRIVVIDEVAGQLITFVFVPASAGLWVMVAGFILFRLFDVWKPYPVRRLEALKSGLGIMADDVLAGIYAALTLGLIWLTITLYGLRA